MRYIDIRKQTLVGVLAGTESQPFVECRKRVKDVPPDTGCGGLCVKCTECPYPVCSLEDSHIRGLRAAETVRQRATKARR